jgi:hypothetical protein
LRYRLDLVVDDALVVEIKAVDRLQPIIKQSVRRARTCFVASYCPLTPDLRPRLLSNPGLEQGFAGTFDVHP